jgi:hypothetical protein
MERQDLSRVEQQFEQLVRERFPDAPVHRVAVLQYGDEPEIEPGELLARIFLESGTSREEREQVLEAFHDAHRSALRELRSDLDKLPEAGALEIVAGEPADGGGHIGPRIRLGGHRGTLETGGVPLVPVMARLGPADLETVDTLITAGIAANRAEAVRWTLARIRERPAYQQLRQRAQDIDELKSQF